MPRSWATCATGRFDSNTSRTARSRSPSAYFLGLDIAGASPSTRTEPGIGASKFPRVLQTDHCQGTQRGQSPDESQATRRHQAGDGPRQTDPPSLTVPRATLLAEPAHTPCVRFRRIGFVSAAIFVVVASAG